MEEKIREFEISQRIVGRYFFGVTYSVLNTEDGEIVVDDREEYIGDDEAAAERDFARRFEQFVEEHGYQPPDPAESPVWDLDHPNVYREQRQEM